MLLSYTVVQLQKRNYYFVQIWGNVNGVLAILMLEFLNIDFYPLTSCYRSAQKSAVMFDAWLGKFWLCLVTQSVKGHLYYVCVRNHLLKEKSRLGECVKVYHTVINTTTHHSPDIGKQKGLKHVTIWECVAAAEVLQING